ncbi:class I SAM-dependent methyltransferase [Alicyclobacillus sp. ALC3]|uniref:class I SAM-dependent methyltransferase n=1 Tax=Alicyclobacillus sp. ALC3 TaxID=2796143 RepID=UPI0027A19D51|nr:methyltransferase domain-containing protein [Alicyclobacillus sp. ALC3]
MTTINQQDRWNEKYTNRGRNLFQPEEFHVQRVHLLRTGSVLDVACGDGRHAIFLARRGFSVTGVDFSKQGLKRLE